MSAAPAEFSGEVPRALTSIPGGRSAGLASGVRRTCFLVRGQSETSAFTFFVRHVGGRGSHGG